MAKKTPIRLVLVGGAASLSFRDDTGAKRRVVQGEPFEIDADTATILQRDPYVVPWVEPPKASAPADVVAARPADGAAEGQAPAAAAPDSGGGDEGGQQPADDPGAVASGEAGPPPQTEAKAAGATSGAIVLGDIPAGGKTGKG